MWMGGGGDTLAQSLAVLIHQLGAAYPSQAWQNSPDTGTIGDATHQAQGSASDHNPWLNNTVRALDVANSDPAGPDCEALFQMVNRMYAAKDSRVYPNGYAIYRGRITDWDNPGGFHAQQGDPHNNHCHISVSQNPAGYNSTAPWPLTGPPVQEDDMTPEQAQQLNELHYQMQQQVAPAVGAIRAQVQAIGTKVNALGSGGAVDVNALASAIVSDLGPDIGGQLAAAIGQAIAKGAATP